MIVVDTTIVSGFMTPPPSSLVLDWLNAQQATSLYLTTISIAEIGFGLIVMPDGKRRRLLEERFEQFVATAFESRVLSFDGEAARMYGRIRGHRQEIGRPISNFDAQIAAIARSRRFAVATRNVKDFEQCQIDLIDPFSSLS